MSSTLHVLLSSCKPCCYLLLLQPWFTETTMVLQFTLTTMVLSHNHGSNAYTHSHGFTTHSCHHGCICNLIFMSVHVSVDQHSVCLMVRLVISVQFTLNLHKNITVKSCLLLCCMQVYLGISGAFWTQRKLSPPFLAQLYSFPRGKRLVRLPMATLLLSVLITYFCSCDNVTLYLFTVSVPNNAFIMRVTIGILRYQW